MAINDYEGSIDRGQQVELYQFIYGASGEEYLYTDGSSEVVLDEKTYSTLAIKRDKIRSKGDLSGREVKIEVPSNSEIADLFRIFPPGRVVSVIIRQGHLANPDDPPEFEGGNFGVVWTGRILEASRRANTTTLTCESLGAGMRRTGLRRHYQWSCPHVLYGPDCRAAKNGNTGTVTAINGNRITLIGAWSGGNAPVNFIGGMVEWAGTSGLEARGILRVEDGGVIVISGPPVGLEVGENVDVFVGCPHTVEGCETLHNNIVNYGGQPWIPTTGNPVGKNNHV
ncbi:hypothetical protein [Synechococcus virus S-ESS1]|uniref:Bacteriophage phiJL001 Gp84 C-terminal domain-containing protein n=1 Tax=Synechococcus virus S-ESS1 TaxID=1964565 RepID=A0A1V0DX31_9CAUD|nr:tail assembly protein [Synechococcus virus S-ESS1]ARB05718.1 hypothetical protein [Synechococcus virus S-ESS1]